jgi:hypothetical protein
LENQLKYCDNQGSLGGFRRVRIAESRLIYQQDFQTEIELNSIDFWGGENWTASWDLLDKHNGELKIEAKLDDFFNENYSFRIFIEVDVLPIDFLKWFRTRIQNRRFAVELLNNNGLKRCLNPFFITYTYSGESSFEKKNRYELAFQRAKMIDYQIDSIIDTLVITQTCELSDELIITQTCELSDELIITQTCEIQVEFTTTVTYF